MTLLPQCRVKDAFSILFGCWRLNSSPQPCAVSTLPMEPCLESLSDICYTNTQRWKRFIFLSVLRLPPTLSADPQLLLHLFVFPLWSVCPLLLSSSLSPLSSLPISLSSALQPKPPPGVYLGFHSTNHHSAPDTSAWPGTVEAS